MPPLDSYSIRARLWPVLLVALPGILVAISWIPEAKVWWSAVSWVVLGSGIPALFGQIGRDLGKNKQPGLWSAWGGAPTTRLLRHRDAPNPIILARRHQCLNRLLPELSIPTAEAEAADPTRADNMYEACAEFLRNRTRDKKKFSLVFAENCNYGFRRNLWGMKPIGVMITGVSVLVVITLIWLEFQAGSAPNPLMWFAGAANTLMLLIWVFWITPEWVKTSADAYAEALLSACDNLEV